MTCPQVGHMSLMLVGCVTDLDRTGQKWQDGELVATLLLLMDTHFSEI